MSSYEIYSGHNLPHHLAWILGLARELRLQDFYLITFFFQSFIQRLKDFDKENYSDSKRVLEIGFGAERLELF